MAERVRDSKKEYNDQREYQAKYREEKAQDRREYQREYAKKNKERILAYQKKYIAINRERFATRRFDARMEVFSLLGGPVCCKCGYDSDVRALQIDHINGGGYSERRRYNHGYDYYKHIIELNGVGYQILCANCNWIKKYENSEDKAVLKHDPAQPGKIGRPRKYE